MPDTRREALEKTNEEETLKKMLALALEQYNWNCLSTSELRVFIRLLGRLERARG